MWQMYPKLKKNFGTKNCLGEGNIFRPTSCESEHEPSKSSFPVSDRDLRRETRFGRSGTRREIGAGAAAAVSVQSGLFSFFSTPKVEIDFCHQTCCSFLSRFVNSCCCCFFRLATLQRSSRFVCSVAEKNRINIS